MSFLAGKPAALYDTTNPDWIPTVQLGDQSTPVTPTSR